jgi:predicted branched-subunit amino acid permease
MMSGSFSYGSPARAALGGVRDAFGTPLLVLGASYVGFGSLVRASGLSLPQGLVSTAAGWALPGQIIVAEMYAVGASLLVIMLAVGLTNARLLPMVMALLPQIQHPRMPRWVNFYAAHLIAITSWVHAMRRCPTLPEIERMPYLLGIGTTLWASMLPCTAAGYLLVQGLPPSMALGLVFLNPLYFMLVLIADLRSRARLLAIVFGGVAGPLLHLLDPDWGLLATGLLAGTAAFLAARLGGGENGR